jgi:hypothetical protein
MMKICMTITRPGLKVFVENFLTLGPGAMMWKPR